METARGLLRSGTAAMAVQLVRIVALQATHIYVRRLIPPDEIAVWYWLEPLFLLLATLRDLGVPSHVVRLRPMPIGTLLRVELGWGAALGAVVFTAAPAFALALRDSPPTIVAAIRVLIVYLLLEGAAAVALTWFEGTLAIERTLPAEIARTATYCTVLVAATVHGLGFWSFVVAQIAAQAIYACELWRRTKGEMNLHHEPGSTPRVVRESLPVGTVWLLAMAVTYVDYFIVGRLFTDEVLGLYGTGYLLAFLVTRILQQPFGRSLYPALVAFGEKSPQQFRAYRLATVLFLAIEVPAALFLAINAELVVLLLAGERYLGAAPYLALLAFAPIVDPLGRFGGELLMARHLDWARNLALGLQLTALVCGGIALSLAMESPLGMAWANFAPLGSIVVLATLARGADRGELGWLGRQLAEVYLVPLLPFALAWAIAGNRPWLRLATTSVAALAALGWSWHRHRDEFGSFFRRDAVT